MAEWQTHRHTYSHTTSISDCLGFPVCPFRAIIPEAAAGTGALDGAKTAVTGCGSVWLALYLQHHALYLQHLALVCHPSTRPYLNPFSLSSQSAASMALQSTTTASQIRDPIYLHHLIMATFLHTIGCFAR